MKLFRIVLLPVVLLVLCMTPFNAEAQLFNGVNYQAVLRDTQGDPLVNQSVTILFEVRASTPAGAVVFSDSHTTTSDERGLVNSVIGKGTSITGDLGDLDYTSTDYYLQVSIDGNALPAKRLEAVPMSYKATNMELDELADVETSAATAGQVLQWDGTKWIAATPSGGGGGGFWTQNTASGIESLTRNVAIGTNAHNNKRLVVECDSMPTGIYVANLDQSTGPEIPQGIYSFVDVANKPMGTGFTGLVSSNSPTTDSIYGSYMYAYAPTGDPDVYGTYCSATGLGNGKKFGVVGYAAGPNSLGVLGTTTDPGGYGIMGQNTANGYAGYFEGELFTDSRFSVNDVFTVRPNVSNSAVKLDMKNASAVSTVEAFATGSNMGGGKVWISDAAGSTRIALNVDNTGEGTVITDKLEIRGGSDLAEYFEASPETGIEAGNVVVLDVDNPGRIKLSDAACDKRVIGIVSGANGVKPGMMMGQEGTVAYGDVPVAIAGRAFVKVDETTGRIEPGDMLTTSDSSGRAMKVSDWNKARGAIIGKALTVADDNGFVLVLVNLQ